MGRRASGSSLSLTLGLVVVAVVAVILGYLMGNYAINLLTTPRTSQEAPAPVAEAPSIAGRQPAGEEAAPAAPGSTLPEGQEPEAPLVVTMEDQPPAASSRPGALFRVQVGAFAAKENAQALAKKLKAMGYEAWVTTGSPYRVQVGAFSTRERAESLKKELKGKGYEAVLVVQ